MRTVGDIADDHYNKLVDDGYWFDGVHHRAYPPTVCKRCGSHAVYWQTVQMQFKLYSNQTLQPHICDEASVRKTIVDDFEDLDL